MYGKRWISVLTKYFIDFSWKSRSQIGRKLGFAASKTVSKLNRFKQISNQKLNELKQEKLKRRTYSKVQWAVKAYEEWRRNLLSSAQMFDLRVYETDLARVELLERDSFEYAMCKFLAEVRKVDGSEYPGQYFVSISSLHTEAFECERY